MKILLTEEEVAQIIADHYEIPINNIEWLDENEQYLGFTVNAKGVTIIE